MEHIRGVNLGGWFVLESWMRPALFEGLTGPDETHFMQNHPNPHQALEQHYQTFITEADFQYLKARNITQVRLPVPWWFLGTDLYHRSKEHIDRAFEYANRYGIQILLDLHTAPGCQNGFDNGGITGVIDWPKDKKNIDQTIKVLKSLASLYHENNAFVGIEVLNEPHSSIDIDIILDFYERSYQEIRKITQKLIVFHDAFRPKLDVWKTFFKNKDNVAFDLHLYHCFDERIINGGELNHLKVVIEERHQMIQKLSKFVRVIVGEWSLGLRESKMDFKDPFSHDLFVRLLADLQLYVYNQAFGFYFWNYKIDRESHLNWDMRRMIEADLLPENY
ncbi:glycoside hydrolase family 5 protein [Paracholeplasma manati]|uniref:glycoside hydrolase family 5 protein n=1 Tax=Paracholeplasma manati TaxID=591373 RepID=UPI0024086A65|nr:cellulase family glycosylhydrolase [Paracholeplasma manati]MDG0889250.1 cellulase family glycosylhydrolase [Paracholeplasma manati]